ncbi:hypothetical protein GCM10027567_13470 [Spongiibacter taiwanensis]
MTPEKTNANSAQGGRINMRGRALCPGEASGLVPHDWVRKLRFVELHPKLT